ncbi:MAG: hypothetical protein K6E81_03290 [Lachnospiraceae bacterium]|nr:hypothetical protein [Lachnospiraceae bacterium]
MGLEEYQNLQKHLQKGTIFEHREEAKQVSAQMRLTEEERQQGQAQRIEADYLTYRARMAGESDAARLGGDSYKSRRGFKKKHREQYKQAQAFTTEATAYTLEIRDELRAEKNAVTARPDIAQSLFYLKTSSFTGQMFLSGYIHTHFAQMLQMLRTYQSLQAATERLELSQGEEVRQQLAGLREIMELLEKRLRVYCESNRVTMDGRAMQKGKAAAQMTQEELQRWFVLTGQRELDEEHSYDTLQIPLTQEQKEKAAGDVAEEHSAQAQQLRRMDRQQLGTAGPLLPEQADIRQMSAQERIAHLSDFRTDMEVAEYRLELAKAGDLDALALLDQAEEQKRKAAAGKDDSAEEQKEEKETEEEQTEEKKEQTEQSVSDEDLGLDMDDLNDMAAFEQASKEGRQKEAIRMETERLQRKKAIYLLTREEAHLALLQNGDAQNADTQAQIEQSRKKLRVRSGELRALQKRSQKEEAGQGEGEIHYSRGSESVYVTRDQATGTDSDRASIAARLRIQQTMEDLMKAGQDAALPREEQLLLRELGLYVSTYVYETRYRVGYTKETENLKLLLKEADRVLAKLSEGQVKEQVKAFVQSLHGGADGGLQIPAGAVFLNEMRDGKPVVREPEERDTGRVAKDKRRGKKRTALIRFFSHWKDQREEPLFSHEPTVNDLKQRLVSNCYMMAATATLAEMDPQMIKDCLKDNGNGTVTVRLYREGANKTMEPVYIVVNKTVPRIGDMDALSAGALWMQMIEKAAAILGRDHKEGYRAIWYGKGGTFLQTLTGRTPEENLSTSSDENFEDICHWKERGLIFNAGTKSSLPKGAGAGLMPGHAYSILGGKVEGGQKYVLLRNPYATKVQRYSGSDDPESEKSALSGHAGETFGQFYIRWEDFGECFENLQRTRM